MEKLNQFKILLWEIRQNDTNYAVRNRKVLQALGLAAEIGYPCGVRLDPEVPEWPVIYIELPVGQVSWHLPEHNEPFDGHSTDEKYHRILNFIK